MAKQSDARVKIGVVGCGGVSQIIHLPFLSQMPDVNLTAICDVDARKASVLADRFRIPNVFDDIDLMLNSCDLDAVFILTPNSLHLPMALLSLHHGKHVFLERPAGRNLEETRRIAEAAGKSGKGVMIGMHTRFRPDLVAVHQFVEQKRFGEVFFIKAEWLQAKFQALKEPWHLSKGVAGGGVVLDLGLQLIDTAWWITGFPEIESVKAHSQQINHDLEVEDFCSFYMRFNNGLKLACHVSWNFPIPSDRFHGEIFGESGACSLNPFKINRIWQGKELDVTPMVDTDGKVLFRKAYQSEIRHFIDFVKGRFETPSSDINQAVKVMEMIEWVYRSLESNREIRRESPRK